MTRHAVVVALVAFACLSVCPNWAQQAPTTQPGADAAGGARGGRGGRGGGVPGMTPEAREAFVAVRTTNTYQPAPRKNAAGTMVTPAAVGVEMIPDDLRAEYRIDPFYKKCIRINGIVVIGSMRVSDYAFLEAAYTLDRTFYESPEWVRECLAKNKIRMSILSVVEFTMDLPENNRNGRNSALADAYFQDMRSRGLGGMPWCSCAEENLLNLRGDRYGGPQGLQGQGENITIHEFAHTLASAIGVTQGRDGPFWTKLNAALAAANGPGGALRKWNEDHPRADGSPGNVYGSTNAQEYWAEGAQAWFDNANPNNSGGFSTREDVKTKDPLRAALLAEIYGDGPWRYIKTTAKKPDGTPLRPPEELKHLEGINRDLIPVFNNNNSPRVQAAATQPEITQQRGGGGGGRGRGRGGAATQRGMP